MSIEGTSTRIQSYTCTRACKTLNRQIHKQTFTHCQRRIHINLTLTLPQHISDDEFFEDVALSLNYLVFFLYIHSVTLVSYRSIYRKKFCFVFVLALYRHPQRRRRRCESIWGISASLSLSLKRQNFVFVIIIVSFCCYMCRVRVYVHLANLSF